MATANWVTDAVHSVCIDLGDPASVWTNEPSPNGSRINAGAFGNTTEASKSRTNAWLRALSLNDGGTISGTLNLYWTGGNLESGALVRVEYSNNGGSDWLLTPNGTNILASASVYAWNTAGINTNAARWRVTAEADSSISDTNDTNFTVNN